jgi:hypothetical protein
MRGATVAALTMAALQLAGAWRLAAQDEPVAARAASVTGAAFVYSHNSDTAFALATGFLFTPGDRVDTRRGGRVVLDLSDGSMVVVEPQSLVMLKDYRQASSLRELFAILLGEVKVRINHFGGHPNPYRMNSPTASLAVRGTEFTVQVALGGATEVMVADGAVQVTSLADPTRTVLVEAGHGALVESNGDLQMVADNNPALRPLGDGNQPALLAAAVAPPSDAAPPPLTNPGHGRVSPHQSSGEDTPAPAASTCDGYLSSLSDVDRMAFLFRFNAFADAQLDSLENPAYATQFQSAEARVLVLPTLGRGPSLDETRASFGPGGSLSGTYSISPQISIFAPLGRSNFFIGGSASGSRLTGDSSSGASSTNFYTGSLVAARRLGSTSIGVEMERSRGAGSLATALALSNPDGSSSLEQILAASRIMQTRLTVGLSHDFGRRTKLGVFYRYGFLSANEGDLSHTLNGSPVGLNAFRSGGHTAEIGFRLRGVLKPRLLYGMTGSWLGVSLADGLAQAGNTLSHGRDGAHQGSAGFGIGYVVSRRVLLTVDTAAGASSVASTRFEQATGNLLQNGVASGRFFSTHAAIETDLTRRLFVTASFMNVWHGSGWNGQLFPDQYGAVNPVQDALLPATPSVYQLASHISDFGAGWRFPHGLLVQYLFTTDYGATASSHSILLRYTFKLHRDE